MKKYRICFVGIGSIAKRHLKNINEYVNNNNICIKIDVLRSGEGAKIDDRIRTLIDNIYYKMDDIKDNYYDAVFVTNPTAKHAQTLKCFAGKTKAFFIEKPVFHTSKISLEEIDYDKNKIYYIACPLRYTNVIKYLKENIDFNKILSMRVMSASYLPDWRPNSNYRESYSAKKELGGGVSIDLIHEWDYITYLMGEPLKVDSMIKKISPLEINSDDIAVYIADYGDRIVELHLDYFSKVNTREILITANDFVIRADLLTNEIEYLNSGQKIQFVQDRDDFQKEEIEFFFNLLEGKEKNLNDIKRAIRTLKIAEGNI